MREEGAWLGEEKIGVDRGVFSSAYHLRRKSFLLNFRRKLEKKVRIGEGVGLMRNYIFALLLFNFFFFFLLSLSFSFLFFLFLLAGILFSCFAFCLFFGHCFMFCFTFFHIKWKLIIIIIIIIIISFSFATCFISCVSL